MLALAAASPASGMPDLPVTASQAFLTASPHTATRDGPSQIMAMLPGVCPGNSLNRFVGDNRNPSSTA